jgi:hypothetical protein
MLHSIAKVFEIGWLLQTLTSAENQGLRKHIGGGRRKTQDGSSVADSKPASLSQEGEPIHARHHQI